MIVYDHTLPLALLILMLIVGIVAGGFSIWRYLSRNRFTVLLAALYLATLGLLTWCLLLPGEKDEVTRLLKPRFVVVLDNSASMTLTPGEETPSRWAAAQEALSMPWTTLVGAECEIDLLTVGEALGPKRALVESNEVQPDGQATRLRDGLKQISERYAGLNLAGVLLLSDGSDTVEAFDDWAVDICPFPVHTVRLQPDEGWQEEPDVRIDEVHTPRRVTVEWTTEMKVMVSGQGTQGQSQRVQLFRDEILIQEKPVQLPPEGGAREVPFTLEHPEVGSFTYRVHVPPLADEGNIEDNSYELGIQVSDARNRLLYVEGLPRWEYKFLKRVLQANPQVTPMVFYTGYDGTPRAATQVGTMTTEMTEAQLMYFKVVVLGNLDAGTLTETQADTLSRFVETGGSLVLLGGPKTWGVDGSISDRLSRILPVRAVGMRMLQGDTPYAVSLTDLASSHPAFAGDPEFWANLPPVLSLFQGAEALPAAQVLVEATTPQGPQPMVVSHRYGQGKVTVILTDSLWRWQLAPDAEAAQPYSRFWAQLISWLVPKEEELEAGRVDLSADRDRMFLGETVSLTARVGAAEEGVMRCVISLPDKQEVPYVMNAGATVRANSEQAAYGLDYTVESPGLHQVKAVWTSEGQSRESDPVSFFVKAFSPEKVPRPINQTVLRSIAAGSGGVYHETLEDMDAALSSLDTQAIEEDSAEYHTLWRTPLIISVLMLLLSASWITRKLRNMP